MADATNRHGIILCQFEGWKVVI